MGRIRLTKPESHSFHRKSSLKLHTDLKIEMGQDIYSCLFSH